MVDTHTFDAIVVGSGMTGGWAAKELTEAGLRTLVLERGGPVAHVKDYPTARLDPWELPYGNLPTQQDLQDYPIQSQLSFLFGQDVKHFLVKDVDHPYEQKKPFHWFRGYQVGGRSLLWSRHCFRWSDLDFEANLEEGVGIDWPLRYADLAPWYDRVQAFIGISGEKAGLPQLPEGDLLPPFEMNCFEQHLRQSIATSFPGRNLIMSHVAVLTRPHNGRGACQGRNLCHRGCPYGAYFSSNSSTLPAAAATGRLTLRPHSIAHSLIADHETGRAKGVRVIDAETGKAEEFHARLVFLNASTLATTGLLLHSTSDRFPNGFANGSGVLGHYLMDHTNAAGALGAYSGLSDKYYKGRRPSGMYIPRFRNLRPGEGRPFTRGYAFEVYTGRSGWRRGNDGPGIGADLKESMSRPGDWYAYMEGYCETLPRYENTVSLSRERRDRWGLPLLQVDMAYSDNERAMLKDVKETATEMLKAARCESVQGFEREPVPGEVIHEMGTARMGRDPKTSFLNGFNQCHESPNVFVTDGSCMPSTACQNPSFTYMALTARACRYAVEELKRGALLLLAVLLVAGPAPAQARDRRGDVSLQVSVRSLHEFDETEAGLGARLSYRLTRWLAADGEVSVFPSDVGSPAFSGSRREGLAGVRGGPHLGRTGAFLALRAGAVRFSEAPTPFPCILIYPPPLVCALAGGDTIPTVQLTGGFEAYPRDRLVVRVEAGDQLLRYSGPAFTADREVIDKGLWSHNFKATASVGLRF